LSFRIISKRWVFMSYFSEFFTAFKEDFVKEIKIGDIGKEIANAIQPHEIFRVQLGEYSLVVTDAVVATWVVMAVIAVLAWLLGRKPKKLPTSKRQLVAESLINLLMNICQSSNMTYKQAEAVVPYVGTIAVFISLTNLASMFKISPPAKNPAFPIALALFTICYVIGMSVQLPAHSTLATVDETTGDSE